MTDHLGEWLAEQSSRASDPNFRPERFDLSRADQARELEQRAGAGLIHAVYDTLEAQLAELLVTRRPDKKLERTQVRAQLAEHVGGMPLWRYGPWFLYPWSGRLVHVLPEAEFRELRTSRNKNKITATEQARLAAAKIAVAGLSVGQATAIALALEGIGGQFRLADFDLLELSNMNRLRAGVHEIGVNKAVVTARAIYEIDPFADVRVFDAGVTEHNLDAFLAGDGKVDLLFDECDDLQMKIRLREEARKQRIVVLMETSDRGLFDIERFDLEPERPILHGLVGKLKSSELKGLSTYEKVPIVMRMIGAEQVSRRLAASMVDIDTTLKTWPQLASGVALGSAINADAARRVLLGQFTGSGRYYVDLEELVSNSTSHAPALDDEALPAAAPLDLELPPLPLGHGPVTREKVRALVAYATLAPSGGNCQPWRFEYDGRRLLCFHDRARSESLLDYEHTASYLAFGALLENMSIVARAVGVSLDLRLFPDQKNPVLVASVGLAAATPDASALGDVDALAARVTNRRLGPRRPLSGDVASELVRTAQRHGAALTLVTEPAKLDQIGDVIAVGERIRLLSKTMHQEMMHEIRWSSEEAARTRDGLDLATLELTATDLAGLRLVSSWPVMSTIGQLGAGRGLEKPTRNAIAAASAVGRLSYPDQTREGFVQGGRALLRVWIEANRRGLAFQPMTALLYLFARVHGSGAGLSARERQHIEQLAAQHRELLPVPAGHAEIMLFRLSEAAPPTARALRRRVDDVLVFTGG